MSNSVAFKYIHSAVQPSPPSKSRTFSFSQTDQLTWFCTTAHCGNTLQIIHSCVDEQGSFQGSAAVNGAAVIIIVMSTERHVFPVEC